MMASSPSHPGWFFNQSLAPTIVGVVTSTLCLGLIAFGMRMYSRLCMFGNPGLDDWLMVFAAALAIIDWTLVLAPQIRTDGKHMELLSTAELIYAQKLGYINIYLWIWNTPKWNWGLGFVVFLHLAIALFVTATLTAQCKPIAANWNLTLPGANCWSPTAISWTIYVPASILVATDLACALLPLFFIRQIRRPLREKIVLGCIMGIGIGAFAIGIAKIVLTSKISTAADPLWQNAKVGMLAFVEQNIGIMAANIPPTKAMLEQIFVKLGGRINQTVKHSRKIGSQSTGYTERSSDKRALSETNTSRPGNTSISETDESVLMDLTTALEQGDLGNINNKAQ